MSAVMPRPPFFTPTQLTALSAYQRALIKVERLGAVTPSTYASTLRYVKALDTAKAALARLKKALLT